jgi:hypothetical protein
MLSMSSGISQVNLSLLADTVHCISMHEKMLRSSHQHLGLLCGREPCSRVKAPSKPRRCRNASTRASPAQQRWAQQSGAKQPVARGSRNLVVDSLSDRRLCDVHRGKLIYAWDVMASNAAAFVCREQSQQTAVL